MTFSLAALSLLVAATPIRLEEVREGARRNVEALQSELELRRATDQVTVARSAIYPQLSLRAGSSLAARGQRTEYVPVPNSAGSGYDLATRDLPPIAQGNFDLQLSVSQLLYDGGRWWNAIAQAGAQEEAASGQLAEQRMSSVLEAVRRYYELFRAQRTAAVLQDTVKQSELQLERANALFEAGRGQKRESIAAQVNLGNDRIAVLRQSQRIVAAQADLALWLARPGSEELVAVDPGTLDGKPTSPPPPLRDALAQARERRPLLMALSKQVRAAELGVSMVQSGYYPTVSAFAGYGRQSPNVGVFADPARQHVAQVGLNVQWDFFSGFRTNAQTRQAEHSKSAAQLSFEQAQRQLEADLRRAHVSLDMVIRIADLALQNQGMAAKGLALAEDRFQAGAGSTLEVRDAQLKLTQAELSLLESRIDVEIAREALARAMGTGEQP